MAYILVVDDDKDNRESLAESLAAAGHTVSIAANGLAGLHRLSEKPIDLVLLDVLMPMMSGPEVLSEMRRIPALAKIPVIVTTALPTAVRSDDAAPVVAILAKPVSTER
jgi:CheY-like chemotaxis protein